MNASRILVVGGYGAVGSSVAAELGRLYPGRVWVGGRDPRRARPAPGVAGALRVDVADVAGFGRLLDRERIAVVVMCVEPAGADAVSACVGRGVHVVDLGASDERLALIEAVDAGSATVILSVGLAPGITNLLARRASERLGGAEYVDIAIMLGAGERHGREAVRWTVRGLAAPASGTARIKVGLPGIGRRTAYPFPFSDQHTLRRTLGVDRVTTRLCLESEALGAALFGARKLGVFRLARQRRGEELLTGVLHGAHLGGTDAFAVRVDARRGRRRVACGMSGHNQSRMTARVAVEVMRLLEEGALPPGVQHIDQVPVLAEIPDRLAGAGTTSWTFDETA
ncbi:saccharopine dehydrogenase NADP-binding domain-containing protein [Pseudonocardia sp. CA-107938]|uniref:saccharopine dehydrogenase NADP-binding domain-containing protein n=1 Tax=Pseudonocardia sp. CA-107938 TaxID=3240021 RepID=UPI003D8F56A0